MSSQRSAQTGPSGEIQQNELLEETWFVILKRMTECSELLEYTGFLQANSWGAYLQSLRNGCPIAWNLLVKPENIRNKTEIHKLPSPEGVKQPGFYLAVISHPVEGDFLRFYVGQSKNVSSRVADHKRNIKNLNKTAFIYTAARKQHAVASFYLLGISDETAVSNEHRRCWMNVCEHFWAVIFQSLPVPVLKHWLPGNTALVDTSGLNIALPLYQGFRAHQERARNGFPQLYASKDPLVIAFAFECSRRGSVEAHNTLERSDYKQISDGRRKSKNSNKGVLWSEPDPALQDCLSVEVICAKCRRPDSMRIDNRPTYTIKTRKYISRPQR